MLVLAPWCFFQRVSARTIGILPLTTWYDLVLVTNVRLFYHISWRIQASVFALILRLRWLFVVKSPFSMRAARLAHLLLEIPFLCSTRYSRLFRHPFKFTVIPPRNFSFRSCPIRPVDISNGMKTIWIFVRKFRKWSERLRKPKQLQDEEELVSMLKDLRERISAKLNH